MQHMRDPCDIIVRMSTHHWAQDRWFSQPKQLVQQHLDVSNAPGCQILPFRWLSAHLAPCARAMQALMRLAAAARAACQCLLEFLAPLPHMALSRALVETHTSLRIPFLPPPFHAQVTGGRNGYGAKLANIFSTHFCVETADGTRLRRFKQTFTDNMGK